ncbi:alginate lyase family protein [Paenibacillus sp. N4]|uniref:alginate lyase family protein n=1 Tax=Paenibacillus vietnamensis TaxID=2590547 RepID=UPI001CD08884|nr:alginate lyase family protein [Paenibacillus vietnamensis]MCA0755865.1 alginate lyase family protein [Paenibacillus vietnamensis]
MRVHIDLFKEWNATGSRSDTGFSLHDKLLLEYPAEEDAAGWYPIGFERGNHSALDAMGWYGLILLLNTEDEAAEVVIKAHFADDRTVEAKVSAAGTGERELRVRLEDFEIEAAKANIWRFLKGFELQGNAELRSARLVRGERLFVQADVRGKSGDAGEAVEYRMTVYNCTDERQLVSVNQKYNGWESLHPELAPRQFMLEPLGSREITAVVRVHETMVPGGHETTVLGFIANGDGGSAVQVELKTLRSLSHPYIYWTKEQWAERKALIERHESFRPGYKRMLEDADAWTVKPPVPVEERDYCYDTREEHYIMSAAYAYALTGERRYAEKVAQFFRYFIDEETGYPRKKKGCSQSYVQEGHFFQHLAIPYDIIHDAGVLTPEEHKGVEKCFRIYMDILDHHIQRGHISNWLLSEITGAFYCALAIQDMERALRFVYGPGGSVQQLSCGLFNDGWWHECSVGYNTWVSSMYIHTAHALLPFGINILHTHFPIPFNDEVDSTYGGQNAKIRFGMYNKKWGGNRKSYVRIKDLFDATIPFLDHRGVLFGISDSDEKKLEGVHFGSTYDLAYTYYKDPEYIPVIKMNNETDPIFGHAELPDYESSYVKNNAFADNVGVAMLRSRTAERERKEQIQAVLRYGSHGFAHGHFDRTGLLSVMRYGRSFFNPEHVWWGYAHFMYKFYVQNSITKNMVTVDGKMQVPADSRRSLFYSGSAIQAAAVETTAPWAFPPYGGMVYRENETLEERCAMNASSLPPQPADAEYGKLSAFTEPVRQKRVMGVTDDFIVLFDYLQGEREHQFDCLFQIKGFKELKAERLKHIKHTSQWSDHPLSDAQFVTDCQWYEAAGTSVARFETVFGEGEDLRGTRTSYNTQGPLKMDVHTAWPQRTEQIIGRAAEYHGITIPMEYAVEADGAVIGQGGFGAWILGEGKVDLKLGSDVKVLTLRVKNHPTYTEQKYPERTKQGLFWGEACVITADGMKLRLTELSPEYINVDTGFGIGKDYEGGRVTIVGNEYPGAIPASPVDHEQEAVIRVGLEGLRAVRFVGLIGADAFPGDEAQRRMTYGIRMKGETGRFITVVEPHESDPMIVSVHSSNENTVRVELKDGRSQEITVQEIESDHNTLLLREYRNGSLVREELAKGK